MYIYIYAPLGEVFGSFVNSARLLCGVFWGLDGVRGFGEIVPLVKFKDGVFGFYSIDSVVKLPESF